MKKFFKKGFILFIFIFVLCSFAGCSQDKPTLDILADSVVDVPAGEYTLRYTITDYDKYSSLYQLSLSVHVYDENNVEQTVTNNRTVTLEADKVYTVVVRVTGKDQSVTRFKQYTLTTVKSDITVTLYLRDGTSIQEYATQSLAYGGTLLIGDLPEVPYHYATSQEVEGITRTIISKKWVLLDEDGNDVDITQENLSNLKQDVDIYSSYQYETKLVPHYVTFESNGGSSVATFEGNMRSTLVKPTAPTREGYVFEGWCTDQELTLFYNWKADKTVSEDFTLYARWTKSNLDSATKQTYFVFKEKTDDYGNLYYELSTADPDRITGDIILPNNYNGAPVRSIAEGTFRAKSAEGSKVTSVYIPATYTLGMNRAFSSCKSLVRAEFEKDNLRDTLPLAIFSFCSSLTEVVLPDNITSVNARAFLGCGLLRTINLPGKLVTIGDNVFGDCLSLTSVVIPDSVRTLSSNCFRGCKNLSSITFSENSSIQTMASSCFDDTALRTIKLPKSSKFTLDNRAIVITYYETKEN